MSLALAPDIGEIERAVDGLLQKDAGARVMAMRSPSRRGWPESIQRGGRLFRIAWCPSELEVRESLDAVDDGDDGIVVLTPLDEVALGDDILARFPRGHLEQTDRWSALRAVFRARDVDPRLRLAANRWLVDILLERPPARGYTPAGGGILDLETAWRVALNDVLALSDGRADTGALLRWSLNPAGIDRLVRLPEEARDALVDRLGAEGGAPAALVLAAVVAGRGADALPVALVCGVVFGEAEPRPVLREAAIRLEAAFGGRRVDPLAGQALAEAGHRLLDALKRDEPGAARVAEMRAAAILMDVRADTAVELSPALSIGLDARMKEAASLLRQAVETRHRDAVAVAWKAVKRADAHHRASEQRARLDRMVMAARLACWLTLPRRTPWHNLEEASVAYVGDGAFVDRARHALRGGDALVEVGAAYAAVAAATAVQREKENQAFAELLHEWTLRGAHGDRPLRIESVLASVVVPLARDMPVLLLVLDGLSFAVWRDLAETVDRLGWTELVPMVDRRPMAVAAALPTVTEVSRASLLGGALARGDQAYERSAFARNTGLLSVSRAGLPPRLFHKAEVGAGPELEVEVRAAVADAGQRVVGVVHNAVDAQLSGSDQFDLTWTAEGLRQVAALLQACRDAGRVVVVTGDHGHVLEEATELMAGGPGDRWRSDAAASRMGEISLSGSRVLSPAGGNAVVAAWSEKVRFAGKRSGYHGGASPQEVLVPVAVLTAGLQPAGWVEAPPLEPSWWRGAIETDASLPGMAPQTVPPASGRRPIDSRQAELLLGGIAPTSRDRPAEPAWLDALLASEAYATQRRLAGRAALDESILRTLLLALAARGGRLNRAALAQSLGIAAFRLGGVISAARRILNLDQAQVLRDEGDDIALDEALLCVQFSIGRER